MDSYNNFVTNLNQISLATGCTSNYSLSKLIGVNYNTLRGWMANSRSPKLSTLDLVADRLGVNTSDLLNPAYCYKSTKDKKHNKSAVNFRRNLQKAFIASDRTSWQSREALLFGLISVDSLKSFFRKENYRSPSLTQLDSIASALGVKSYELISEEFAYERS